MLILVQHQLVSQLIFHYWIIVLKIHDPDNISLNNVSKILLGQVNAEGEIQLELAPLSMPFELHCHPRNEPVKESLRGGEHDAMMQVVDEACG